MDVYLRRLKKNRFLTYGAPFLVMLVGGSFGLKYFAEIRYQVSKKKMITKEEADSLGVKMKEEKLEPQQELEKLVQETDLDSWENIRGPRPWEDSKTVQDLQRKAQAKLSS